jgi:hypothetical protein
MLTVNWFPFLRLGLLRELLDFDYDELAGFKGAKPMRMLRIPRVDVACVVVSLSHFTK